MRALHKDLMKMIVVELKRELEARAEPKTGSKAWLRRRLHAAIVREHLDASEQGRAFLISRSVFARPPPQRARAPYVENKNKTFSSDFQACGPSNRRFPRGFR